MTKVKDIFSKAGRSRCPARFSGSDRWSPDRPAQFTQKEFLEYIHEVEERPFTPLDIANREFEEWKVESLGNQKPDVPKHYLGFSFDRLSDHWLPNRDAGHYPCRFQHEPYQAYERDKDRIERMTVFPYGRGGHLS